VSHFFSHRFDDSKSYNSMLSEAVVFGKSVKFGKIGCMMSRIGFMRSRIACGRSRIGNRMSGIGCCCRQQDDEARLHRECDGPQEEQD